MAITPEQAQKVLKNFATNITKDSKALQLVACKTVEGLMKKRIFNNGEATDGSKIGTYKSKSHIKKRNEYGAQTSYVDLQMSGDTLFSSLITGESGNDIVVGFVRVPKKQNTKVKNPPSPYEIATYQEKYRGKEIFTPTASEKEKANQAVLIAIKNKVAQALKP